MSNLDQETDLDTALAGLGAGAGAGIIAGRRAKIANKEMLKRAQNEYRFVYASRDPAEKQALMSAIWEETGWYQGPDGEWKFEIPEAGARYKFLQSAATQETPDWNSAGILSDADRPLGVRAQGQLKDFLDFPALYEAYPGIENTQTGQIRLPENMRGVFNDELGFGVSHMLSPEQAASTLTHEVQHGIQGLEGFGRGGSPADVGMIFPQEAQSLGPSEAYHRLAGETEARLTQKRLWHAMADPNQSVEQLQKLLGDPLLADPTAYNTFPLWDQDRPSMDQLVYSLPHSMPANGPINALQLPPGRPQYLLPDSLPVSHEMQMTIPEQSLGETGRYLMSLLKRAFK